METTTRKVILSMQITLDGFVAGPNDEMDWLMSGDDEWDAIFKDLESVDTYLVGSKMYPGYADFWRSQLTDPSAPANLVKYARIADKAPHIVFSKTMTHADWANTRIAQDPATEIAKLKQQPGKDIVVWGGASFAASLINAGLIDEYRLTLNPTLLSKGKALFKDLKEKRKLALISSQPLQSGTVVLRYRTI